MNTQVVTFGKSWETRRFDGVVVDGRYYGKGDARNSENPRVRAEYWRARRAVNGNSRSLSDAPLNQELHGNKTSYYHDLKSTDL